MPHSKCCCSFLRETAARPPHALARMCHGRFQLVRLQWCWKLRQAFHMQVFIPEQVAYSKPDLERHMRTGDLTGPMAESGFKGHPQCRSAPFCSN